jgi:hypothetical protein
MIRYFLSLPRVTVSPKPPAQLTRVQPAHGVGLPASGFLQRAARGSRFEEPYLDLRFVFGALLTRPWAGAALRVAMALEAPAFVRFLVIIDTLSDRARRSDDIDHSKRVQSRENSA